MAPRRGLRGALAAAVAAAAVASGRASRSTVPVAEDSSKPAWDMDVSKLKFEGNQFILPDGTRHDLEEDEKGNYILPNGAKVHPWNGLTPEGEIPTDSFFCHGGKLFGVRLPGLKEAGKRPKRSAFVYVRQADLPDLLPIEVYLDPADSRKQLLLFPPMEMDFKNKWRMIYRVAAAVKSNMEWKEQRLFFVGDEHPCSSARPQPPPPPPPPPPPTRAPPRAARRAEARAASKQEKRKQIGDMLRKAAADRGREIDVTDEEAERLARAAVAAAKNRRDGAGPIASEAMRGLLEENWVPRAFYQMN